VADPNAARLGITLGAAGADGIRVEEVASGGPADRAGLKVGDQLVAINDVSLRMAPADLEDPALADMMTRRLQRTMATKKPGDAITLRVQSGGSPRTLTVTAVAERELRAARVPVVGRSITEFPARNRARLGVSLGGTTSKRDTVGVFVSGVTADGPAEKAGIVEGDRIARVNGVDVRVPREDAGDARIAQARLERLQREIEKLAPGDAVTLTVVTAGRAREVRVTTDSASAASDAMIFRRESEVLERAREALERVRIQAPPAPPARVRVVETTRTRVTI